MPIPDDAVILVWKTQVSTHRIKMHSIIKHMQSCVDKFYIHLFPCGLLYFEKPQIEGR